MLKPRFTYQDLLDRQDFLVTTNQLNNHTAANRVTTLRAFLQANHLCIEDPVGSEMRGTWPDALEVYLNSQMELGRSSRAISNSKAALRPWRDMVVETDSLRAIEDEKPTPFQSQLTELMHGFSIKHVARTTNVPYDMLLGWVHGKRPRQSSRTHLARLESFFGIARGELGRLAGCFVGTNTAAESVQRPVIEYRRTLSERTQKPFWLRPPEGSSLRKQWAEFVAYKVAAVPQLERSTRGQWRISPLPMGRPTQCEWFAYHNMQEVPSARAAWAKVGGFLGWLGLPTNEGGMAIQQDQLQTMGWFVDTTLMEKYVDWYCSRTGGRVNGYIPQFVGWVQSLVRERVGYFCQSPWLQKTLPEQYQGESWSLLCERLRIFCSRYAQSLRGKVEVSRDPFEPMKDIVELAEPMEAVADMVQRMRADRPIGNAIKEAIWARDILLVKLLVSNPLRVRQFSHMTWRADNTGHLYQRADGSWWLQYKKRYFKNARGAAGDLDYDSPVHPSVWRDLERYLFKYRPSLMVAPTDLVFMAGRAGPGHKRTSHVPWRDLSRRVEALTRQYLWKSPGIGGHAFRGLVGTSIIKAAPGEIETVAKVLNDRPLTVQRHYARFTSGDGSKRMGELLAKSLKRM